MLLSRGSTGQDVWELQNKLRQAGYNISVDGIFGPETERAVRDFQTKYGLSVDGVVGQQTWGALARAIPGNTPTASSSSSGSVPAGYSDISPDVWQKAKEEAERQAIGAGVDLSKNPVDTNYIASITRQKGNQTTSGGYTAPIQNTGGNTAYSTTPVTANGGTPRSVSTSDAAGTNGYVALQAMDIQKLINATQVPQDSYNRLAALLERQPMYTPLTDEELRKRAEEMAALIVNPQELAARQALERSDLETQNRLRQLEAAYSGMDEDLKEALNEVQRRAVESAIARGGARGGLTEWLTREMGEPVMREYARALAQKAAQLTAVQQEAELQKRQLEAQLAQLAATRGQLTSQQLAALRDTEYARKVQEFQNKLAAEQALAGLRQNAQQASMQTVLNLLPYVMMTQAQRQSLPLEWSQTMGQTPSTAPSSVVPSIAEDTNLVPVRAYAAAKGMPNAVDWDERNRQVIINGVRINLDQIKQLGGDVSPQGISYLPKRTMDLLLGVA